MTPQYYTSWSNAMMKVGIAQSTQAAADSALAQ
jgi:hypothetical protein